MNIPIDGPMVPKSSAFYGRNILYGFEKIGEYIRQPNFQPSGGYAQLADFWVKNVVTVLADIETKMRQHGTNPRDSHFPQARYAVMELQKYVTGDDSSISSGTEAEIFRLALLWTLEELRRSEMALDGEPRDV